jgi:CDP-diacylglycerol---serine O-phosphatidyltransferase
MKIKKAIPHLFTCGNLLCGCIAIVQAFEGNLVWSAYLVGIAAVLDFFDGFVARMLGVQGEFGKQLDSLADCVTFGVVPGVVMAHLIWYAVFLNSVVIVGTDTVNVPSQFPHSVPGYLGFLISIFSALRLAKFNLDTRQSDSFIGVPTPANSILICSIPLVFEQAGVDPYNMKLFAGWHTTLYPDTSSYIASVISVFFSNVYVLVGLTILMSFLLVAELPLFALKFKHFKWKGNEIRFIFLLVSLLMLIFLKFVALPLIIVLYVLLSVVNSMFSPKKNPSDG